MRFSFRFAFLAALSAPLVAVAQSYPAKPIRFVLPFVSGSATDNVYRVITDRMRQHLGDQPLIIESRPGAGAVLATQYVMSQPADGYTLMISTSTQTITSATAKPAYDVRNMTHIVQMTGGSLHLAVNTERMAVRTLREFIDYAKANPGKVNFSSYGVGSLGHLATELLAQQTGIQVVHVPFKSSVENVSALVRGDSFAAFDVMATMGPHIQAGRPIRVIAASSAEPSRSSPEFPGTRSSGLSDFDVTFWNGFSGPAGLPREVVQRINAAGNAAAKDPVLLDYATKTRSEIHGGTPEAFTAKIGREVEQWREVIRRGNIEVN